MVDISADDLKLFRESVGLKHHELGRAMGLSRSVAYRLERDPAVLSDRHVMLLEALAIRIAVERRDPALLLPHQIPMLRMLASLVLKRQGP